ASTTAQGRAARTHAVAHLDPAAAARALIALYDDTLRRGTSLAASSTR
ncbi:MAG: hypothetical protein HOQ45_05810, partial [Nocardioidaceae bacterium]|nr:hypothetical protein [Nocardioidaceae bacterium]